MNIIELKEDENGDLILELPDNVLQMAGFVIGDTINMEVNDAGHLVLTKAS